MLVSKIFLRRGHRRQYQFDAILELLLVAVGERRLEAIYVEWITNELLININKEFVSFQRAEPIYPSKTITTGSIDTSALHVHLIREAVNVDLLLPTGI